MILEQLGFFLKPFKPFLNSGKTQPQVAYCFYKTVTKTVTTHPSKISQKNEHKKAIWFLKGEKWLPSNTGWNTL